MSYIAAMEGQGKRMSPKLIVEDYLGDLELRLFLLV
jgi:hypothetical protein